MTCPAFAVSTDQGGSLTVVTLQYVVDHLVLAALFPVQFCAPFE